VLGAGAIMLGSLATAFAIGGYRVNFTPSYAYGLWKIVPLDRQVRVGDRIFICPPPGAAAELALERGSCRAAYALRAPARSSKR
jgi:type IV secretory pathway protease TraF